MCQKLTVNGVGHCKEAYVFFIMLFHQVFNIHPRADHLIQAIETFNTHSLVLSALLLQYALHNNHLLRTQLPNKHPESIRIARRTLSNKRRHMSLQAVQLVRTRGGQHFRSPLTRRSICETGSFRRSSSSLLSKMSSSSNSRPPAPTASAKNAYLSSFTFSSSDQSESPSSDAVSRGAVGAAMLAASPFVCSSCRSSLSALTGNATLVN